MKKIFFILTNLIFLSRSVFAADCSSLQITPEIELTSSFGKLTGIYDKNKEEISALAEQLNSIEHGLFASGLSTVNIDFDVSLEAEAVKVDEKTYCIIPAKIKLFLGLTNPTIYLSKELQAGSCEYNVVLYHEQVHHQINVATLEYYLPLFKDAAEKLSKKIPPMKTGTLDNNKEKISQMTVEFNQKLLPLVNYIKKEIIKQQQRLDNPQNYKFESKLCQKN